MAKVVVIKCTDYAEQNIRSSIKRIFELLNLSGSIKPHQKILLKPNLLTNLPPERGVTTHPSLIRAVAEQVKGLGAIPFLGDSPGGTGLNYETVLRTTGMKGIGIPVVSFEGKGMRKFSNPGGKIDPIYISNVVLDFDMIINIPKLKTHELTLMTCGIKNMFGCVPGFHKVRYHMEAPNPDDFSESLVDLFERIVPAVTVIDAVVAMEGQGPTNGKLRPLGLIIASKDTVAADAVCSKIMGFDNLEITMTRIAHERHLGEGMPGHIELAGDQLDTVRKFERPSGAASLINRIPRSILCLIRPITDMIMVRPEIIKRKCVKCMACVNACPVKAIDEKSFNINKTKCIMCFCCRELCKYGAVKLKESTLWKISNQLMKLLT